MKEMIKVNLNVSPDFLNRKDIQEELRKAFNDSEEEFKLRYEEMIAFLDEDVSSKILYADVYKIFKAYFLQEVVNNAIKKSFGEENSHDVFVNIISLISITEVEKAIQGEKMLTSLLYCIKKVESDPIKRKAIELLLEGEFGT